MNQYNLKGIHAINVSAHGGSVIRIDDLPSGEYFATIKGEVQFRGKDLPLKEAIVFNTAPLATENPIGWYSIISPEDGESYVGIVEKGKPVYLFLLDQVLIEDNNDSISITLYTRDGNNSKTVTLNGKDAINVTKLGGEEKVTSVLLPTGSYSVTMTSDLTFAKGAYPCKQAILFNTANVVSGNRSGMGWYYAINSESTRFGIDVIANQPVYIVLVDQLGSDDNHGSASVTFTPV